MDLFGYFDYKEALRQKNVRLSIAAFGAIVIGLGGFYLYKYNNDKIQQSAQRSFSEAVDTYRNATFETLQQNNQDQKAKWDEVELAFNIGYEQNKKSTLVPFFLAYESDAQLKMGKYQEAFNKLSQALESFPKDSSYFYLYKIKHALIQIDKLDEQTGLEQLKQLSQDKNNLFKDMSNFYLAEYYFAKNDMQQAKKYYQDSLTFNPESSWANLSKSKLDKFK